MTYQVVFAINFFVVYFSMKALSWHSTPEDQRGTLLRFLSAPYLSLRTFKRKPHPSNPHKKLIGFGSVLGLFYLLLFKAPRLKFLWLPFHLYCLTEILGSMGQILFTGNRDVPIHLNPLRSLSLRQFWGHRWNLWVQDWFKDVARHGPWQVFLISGLFHEVMINLPYWLVYKKSYFGTMLLYFMIQSLALWLDRRYLRHRSPLIQRAYCWLAVILLRLYSLTNLY